MIQIRKHSIEVFRTDVANRTEAEHSKKELLKQYPRCVINFDLDDCDRILRIDGDIEPTTIELFSKTQGYRVARLPD
jgi:hypothetical protein